MVVFLFYTEAVDKINLPLDGTIWSLLLDNYQQDSQAKSFSKHALNSRMFSGGEIKTHPQYNLALHVFIL